MATNYPTTLDTTGTTLPNAKTDLTVTAADHASHHNNIADAILAIEATVGINPAGSYATVAAAIVNKIDKSPSTSQTIQPTSDVVGFIVKRGSGPYISNLLEALLDSGSIVAYIASDGSFSAQGLKISGTALASTHLSDYGTIIHASDLTGYALVASPTFTGTPAAPTAAVNTNTTQLATTAFVLGQASASGDGSPGMDGVAARGTSTHFARADHVHPTDTTLLPKSGGTLSGALTISSGLLNLSSSGIHFNDGTTQTTAGGGGGAAPSINQQSGTSYTFVLGDQDNVVEFNNASPIAVTVPPHASVALGVAHSITLIQTGAGQVSIVAGAGVTINSTPGLKIAAQWGTATLFQRSTNTWLAFGNLTP